MLHLRNFHALLHCLILDGLGRTKVQRCSPRGKKMKDKHNKQKEDGFVNCLIFLILGESSPRRNRGGITENTTGTCYNEWRDDSAEVDPR